MLDSITIARIYFSYGLLKPQLVFFSGGGGRGYGVPFSNLTTHNALSKMYSNFTTNDLTKHSFDGPSKGVNI